MMHKDPTTYSIITYVWVVAISISGGFWAPQASVSAQILRAQAIA